MIQQFGHHTSFIFSRRVLRGHPLAAQSGGPGSSQDDGAKAADKKKSAQKEIVLPKSSYFRLEDTNNEIYGKATERFDPTKRGGRYKSDFIWNEKWQETMKRDEDLDRKRREYVEKEKQGLQQMTASTSVQQPGAISFGLLAQLDNMDVDLSAALMPRKVDPAPPTLKPKTIPTAAAAASVPIPRLNAEKLKRTSRITKPKSVISEKDEDEEERIRVVTAEREAFERKKFDFLTWTLALTALGGLCTLELYDANVSASYTVGAVGGLIYLRLLGKSVDSVGSQSIEGGIGSIASQPRLLIPVILALVFNRWNLLYSAKFGITLQLLPMLIGFFTYKIAVLARESVDVMEDLSPPKSNTPQRME